MSQYDPNGDDERGPGEWHTTGTGFYFVPAGQSPGAAASVQFAGCIAVDAWKGKESPLKELFRSTLQTARREDLPVEVALCFVDAALAIIPHLVGDGMVSERELVEFRDVARRTKEGLGA